MPTLPVYANVTGMPYGSAPVAELLEQQVNHPVRWEQIISHMAADGVDTYLEVGVGNVLQKLVLRILPNCRAFAVSTPDELDAVRKELALC